MRKIAVAGAGLGPRAGAPIQAEALAYFARMTVAPSAQFRDAVNWAIWRWKAIGAWAHIKGLWILSADTAQAGLLSVIGDTPRDAVTVGTAPTFTALKGYSGFDAGHQVKFPITSTILADNDCIGFIAARVSIKTDNVTDPEAPVAVTGCFLKSDAGTGEDVVGNFGVGPKTGAHVTNTGIYGAGPSSPIVAGGTIIVGGSRTAATFNGGSLGIPNGSTTPSRSSNYITRDMAFNPLDRLCAYGFLAAGASNAIARQFHAVLAAMLDQLGALD